MGNFWVPKELEFFLIILKLQNDFSVNKSTFFCTTNILNFICQIHWYVQYEQQKKVFKCQKNVSTCFFECFWQGKNGFEFPKQIE